MTTEPGPATPQFFVPEAAPEEQERVYAELARWCRRPVPPVSERVYSITFDHDGQEWTATVGETLSGISPSPRSSRARGRRLAERGVSDPALVLAIFPGIPYVVATTGGISTRSRWANPFLAGEPHRVTHFSLEADQDE